MNLKIAAALLLVTVANGQPRLLLNQQDLDRIEKTVAGQAWAKEARASLLQLSEQWPQRYLEKYGLNKLALPPEGGSWHHKYVCPQHGVRLEYEKPATHRCLVDRKTFSGWPYDQHVYRLQHNELAQAARDLGLGFRLTGKREYAQAAAWILDEYGQRYPGYPIHDKDNGQARSGGKVESQTLDESIWLIQIAWAYDLVRGTGALSKESETKIERDLLRLAAATIERHDAGISNWQSWHNAAIAAVGFTLNDQDLIRKAIDGKSGFRFQMKKSVMGDGFWYEGAWTYHFYALNALMLTAEMAARNGIDLWDQEQSLWRMFEAPMGLAFADGSLPPFNDSVTLNLNAQAGLYEVAFTRLNDPLLARIAARGERGRNALLWGAPVLATPAGTVPARTVYEQSGYAVLRGEKTDHAVVMKFGPHGGGHGHFDKLGFVSYANGAMRGIDPGTQSYGAPSHETWDKTTVAHNTIVVDERQQLEATGRHLTSSSGTGFSSATADSGLIYKDVKAQRTLLVTDDYALDILEARSTDGVEHTFDWIYHNPGVVSMSLQSTPWSGFGQANGYQHLTENRGAANGGDWQADFGGVGQMRVWMLGAAGTQVVTGNGLGPDLTKPVPFILARRKGGQARYVTLLEPYRNQPGIRAFRAAGQNEWVIEGPGWRDHIWWTGKNMEYERK